MERLKTLGTLFLIAGAVQAEVVLLPNANVATNGNAFRGMAPPIRRAVIVEKESGRNCIKRVQKAISY